MEGADRSGTIAAPRDDVTGASRGAGHAEGHSDTGSGNRAWSGRGRLAPSVRTEWMRQTRKTAYRALVMAGWPTRRARMLPGFLIVGAERCGTTSMFHVLKQHPAVSGTALHKQEVHFFDVAYGRGLGWYRSQFPLLASARLAARGTGATPVAPCISNHRWISSAVAGFCCHRFWFLVKICMVLMPID